MTGVPPSGSGCQPSASAAAASSQSGIPNAVVRVAKALAQRHYMDRFGKCADSPHVIANVEGNWGIFVEDARVAVQAGLNEVAQWQPIETAPNDGSWVLIYTPDDGVETAYWADGFDNIRNEPWSCFLTDGYRRRPDATHWMPLPAPPASAIEAPSGGETPKSGSTEGESAVAKPDAHPSAPSPTSQQEGQ